MKKLSIILALLISLSFTKDDSDILYQNYVRAINNGGTFQFFLVVKIKNLNTNKVREICTKANFLQGAIHREYNIDYDERGIIKAYQTAIKNKNRYFEFKNDSAIANLAIEDYSENDLKKLQSRINFNLLTQKIKKNQKWSSYLDHKELKMYAHALFNLGILTGENSCFGGTLIYVSPKSN
ncbi:hypothetical protein DBB36_10515 [Flavobacterium sp. WLB]|uniref:hypothetical protein n=1 Tax=unclassified Flavobacterium TaxID=196869 RepID=UPI0006AB80DC|nr:MULTISPECIES: hypothetical protein [unclassified Flavobacterium]KOP36685.1 hypothetical protein AKO67_19970 [Flavobacterium sp. VMW]OWU91892.1 hypothetical protein APR43_04520 [Flavobacterium sp. NLM]PUU70062.1 hypothetical protein DBB36_10515 [Flavobacterium sp. WLB]